MCTHTLHSFPRRNLVLDDCEGMALNWAEYMLYTSNEKFRYPHLFLPKLRESAVSPVRDTRKIRQRAGTEFTVIDV